jgi:hypothetical protein
LPFASTEVEIWAWPGEASVSHPPATSTATGMQFVFIMLADLRLLDDNGQRQLTTGLGRQSAIPRTNERHAYTREGGFSGVSIWRDRNYSNRSRRG